MRKTSIIWLALLVLLLSGCHSTEKSQNGVIQPTENMEGSSEHTESTSEMSTAIEKEDKSNEVTSGFYDIVPSYTYEGYTFVSEETARSMSDIPFAYPEYLPESFYPYEGVFIQEDRGTIYTLRFWYNIQDHAVFQIFENKSSPDFFSQREYYYADMEYLGIAHEGTGFRYYATWWDTIDEVYIQGYMLFAEESYEPECKKIIDSISFPDSM